MEEIPDEWTGKRVKDIFCLVTDLAPKNNNYELLSLYTSIGVKPRKDMDEQRGNKSVTTDDYWMVKKGDIIINKLLAWMGAVGLSDYDGVTSPAYDILRKKRQNKPEVDERFYTYLFRTEKAQQIFKRHSRGIMDVRLRLYFDKLGAITVPVPPLPVQKAIADYLDTQTAQIDLKIDLLNQKAQKYAELKEILINETILRGLNKTVLLKDSGVEWIGKTPTHWDIKQFKQFSTMKGRIGWQGLKQAEFTDEGPFLITGMNFKNGTIDWGDVYHISQQRYEEAPEIQLRNNDVLMTKDGTIGKLLFVDSIPFPYKASLNSHLLVFRPIRKSYYPKFMFYQLGTKAFKHYTELVKSGTTFFGISQESVGNYIAVVPPLDEQIAIAEYLDAKTAHIERIIDTLKTEIEKLKELRKTLINDVVTGKIKVYEA